MIQVCVGNYQMNRLKDLPAITYFLSTNSGFADIITEIVYKYLRDSLTIKKKKYNIDVRVRVQSFPNYFLP